MVKKSRFPGVPQQAQLRQIASEGQAQATLSNFSLRWY